MTPRVRTLRSPYWKAVCHQSMALVLSPWSQPLHRRWGMGYQYHHQSTPSRVWKGLGLPAPTQQIVQASAAISGLMLPSSACQGECLWGGCGHI